VTPHLQAVALRQGGAFTRQQAVDAGCTERELKTRIGPHGDWTRVRRGAYADRRLWEDLDEAGRYRIRVHAAALTATEPAVVSHASAAAFLGFPMRPRWMSLVHLTRPGVSGGRVEGGVNTSPGSTSGSWSSATGCR
jgi:hypothetical protein